MELARDPLSDSHRLSLGRLMVLRKQLDGQVGTLRQQKGCTADPVIQSLEDEYQRLVAVERRVSLTWMRTERNGSY